MMYYICIYYIYIGVWQRQENVDFSFRWQGKCQLWAFCFMWWYTVSKPWYLNILKERATRGGGGGGGGGGGNHWAALSRHGCKDSPDISMRTCTELLFILNLVYFHDDVVSASLLGLTSIASLYQQWHHCWQRASNHCKCGPPGHVGVLPNVFCFVKWVYGSERPAVLS